MKQVICLVLACLTFSVKAGEIRNLVFEGAGIKGIAYVGCLKALQDSGALDKVEKVGGTSSGAITATLVALGYNADEIRALMLSTKYQKFNDGEYSFVGGIYRLQNKFGWYKGNEFLHWFEERIEFKLKSKDITFSQLKQMRKVDLCITGTNLSAQRTEFFNVKNYPNMRIADAVRISMSIPIYYEALWMDSAGKIYEDYDSNSNTWLMIDGGMTANFPITIFDSIQPNGKRWLNPYTLAIRIDDTLQKNYNDSNKGIAPQEIKSFSDYMGALYAYTIESLNAKPLIKEDWDRTITVSSGNISSKVRALSKEELSTLYNNGYQAILDYWNG